jgi:hypothetical protein
VQEVQEITESMTTNLDQASQAARDMEIDGCGQTTGG